jgi:F-type H+-transporting ATPase subunit c
MLMHVKNWLGRLVMVCGTLAIPATAFAADPAAEQAAHHGALGLVGLAIAIGLGLSVIGAALGQAKAAAAALEGIARNPNAADKVFVPLLLSLSFIESLVLFVWVLMFLLLNKLG